VPTLNDVLEYQKLLSAQQTRAMEHHYRAQAEVGRRSETVVAHEGWQTFLDHLGQIKDTISERIRHQERTILDTNALGEELVKAKMELRELRGEERGIQHALDLIPSLIETGKRAGDLLG
jgi:hypothetical protein